MSFDWRLYIQLADKLINNQRTAGLQEAYLRSAISRSYYGVFCIARNFLINNRGVTIPKTDTHKFVREEYMRSKNKAESKIGEDLKDLLKERKESDYEDKIKVDINKARFSYQLSLRIFCRLHQIGAI